MSEELRRGIPKAKVIGTRTFTEEEKAENRRKIIECSLRLGIIKPGEEHKLKDVDVDEMEREFLKRQKNQAPEVENEQSRTDNNQNKNAGRLYQR